MTTLPERGNQERVLVVLEGFKVFKEERGLAPLQWAMLNVVHAKDEISVHIVLNYPFNTTRSLCHTFGLVCVRDQEEACREDRYHKLLQRQIAERRQTYIRILRPFYNTCRITGVKFQAKIHAGNQPLQLAVTEVYDCSMTWLVIDRCLQTHWSILHCCRRRKAAVVNDEDVEIFFSSLTNEGSHAHPINMMNPEQEAPRLVKEASIQEDHLVTAEPMMETFGRYENLCRGELEPMVILKEPARLGWDEILEMTNGFRSEQCIMKHEGSEMYAGSFRGNSVSVKRMYRDVSNIIEAEKKVAMSLIHRNILRIVGYHHNESSDVCALVYPSLSRWTLDQYLSGMRRKLPCAERMRIAIGIGQGLRYMHEECPGGPIVHRDLRPCHIYFWHGSQPLISGFQHAKWQNDEVMGVAKSNKSCWQMECSDSIAMAVKSDIFSFGVLLLRLFCPCFSTENDASFIEWARPLLRKRAIHELVDNEMEELDTYEIYKAISAAIFCINIMRLSRFSMTTVVSILKGEYSCVVQSPTTSISSLSYHEHF